MRSLRQADHQLHRQLSCYSLLKSNRWCNCRRLFIIHCSLASEQTNNWTQRVLCVQFEMCVSEGIYWEVLQLRAAPRWMRKNAAGARAWSWENEQKRARKLVKTREEKGENCRTCICTENHTRRLLDQCRYTEIQEAANDEKPMRKSSLQVQSIENLLCKFRL